MKRHKILLAAVLACALLLSGCGGETVPASLPEGAQPYPIPEFHDARFHEDRAVNCGRLLLDSSALAEGYLAVKATGEGKLKLQMSCGEEKYNYTIRTDGEPVILSLNMGNGYYEFKLLENVGDNRYACLWSDGRYVEMEDEFQSFLRPSIESEYTEDSACVALARELAANCEKDSDVAAAVYAALVKNIRYDHDKAAQIRSGGLADYLPSPDRTLEEGKGICYDYASLAAAMLRSLGIPCKIIVGEVDGYAAKHAWNSFYLQEQGWVTVEIKATPLTWQRVDITFAASGVSSSDLQNDGKYTAEKTY